MCDRACIRIAKLFSSCFNFHPLLQHLEDFNKVEYPVVLENSNVAQLASSEYLSVHSQSKEDRYDTDDASPRELYSILVPESTLCAVQSPRRRQHRASVVDRDAQAHRTAALYDMRPGVLGTRGHPHGPQQAPRRDGHTAGEMSALGRL